MELAVNMPEQEPQVGQALFRKRRPFHQKRYHLPRPPWHPLGRACVQTVRFYPLHGAARYENHWDV